MSNIPAALGQALPTSSMGVSGEVRLNIGQALEWGLQTFAPSWSNVVPPPGTGGRAPAVKPSSVQEMVWRLEEEQERVLGSDVYAQLAQIRDEMCGDGGRKQWPFKNATLLQQGVDILSLYFSTQAEDIGAVEFTLLNDAMNKPVQELWLLVAQAFAAQECVGG